MHDQLQRFWGNGCAEKFVDNPAILGYDMLNEPFGDEKLQISPLYEDVAARIRKHDQKAILFIEPQVCPGTPSHAGACWMPCVSAAMTGSELPDPHHGSCAMNV